MNKSILITGISGTGKSAICDELNRLGYKAFNIEEIKGLFSMINKKTCKPFKNFDNDNIESVKQADWICNKRKLQHLMKKNSEEKLVFYCGTASNLNDLLQLFDKIFLLQTNQKILRERLSNRTSNNFGRTAEIQKLVFSWKKLWEDHMKKKGAIIINANHSLQEIAINILKKSKS